MVTWVLSHQHYDHPCGHQWLRKRPPCPSSRGLGIGERLRDVVTAALADVGIDYNPVGGASDWLWCLGGPGVLREPSEDTVEQDGCVDLHLDVCEVHQVVSADIESFDMVAVAGDGTGPGNPFTATSIVLAARTGDVVDAFDARLRAWLPTALTIGDP